MLAPRFTYFFHDEKGPSRAGSDTNYRRWGTSWPMPRFTTGSSICTSLTQPSLAEDKQNLMEPQSVPNKLQLSSSFVLLYKRLKVTSSHELSGKTVISSGRQCRSWRDHFCLKSQQGEGPHSERLQGSDGILQQLWALSTNSGSAMHLGLLIILS